MLRRSATPPSWLVGAHRTGLVLAMIALAGGFAGTVAYLAQTTQNRVDADERFAALSRRVTLEIVERVRRYEYGLRGARGVVVAADGAITREAFARYAASRQFDREFPGARGFGLIFRVPAADEAAFVAARRGGDSPGFSVRSMAPHHGDRYVITYVEPVERNQAAIGLDIASEAVRREAAERAVQTSEATLSAPITLVQASVKTSGGLLLLMAIRRQGGSGREGDLIGWSYAPLLIDDVLRGLDAEEAHFALSLYDREQSKDVPFYSARQGASLASELEVQRITIPLYGRHWEADMRPTTAFVESLHQPSPKSEAIKASLLGGIFAALMATGALLVHRTRGQRLEQARRAAIVEGSADAIIVQTLDGAITDWNDGAARLFGFTREEANGKTATELLLPAELAEEDENIRATVARGGRVQVFETTRRARDGSVIPVSITASPIRDGDGVVVGAAKILRDVREAKAAEQRMRDLNASLEDQVRERTALLDIAMREAREANEAKSRFLANVSHEIRTPMNAVIGLSHMLARTPLDTDQAGMLMRIRTAGKTLMALLNDVLDLSKIEAGEMKIEEAPFRFKDVLDEVSSIASVSAEQRGIAFSVSVVGEAPGPLVGDSVRLAQILLNLLSNAVKFTSHGGVRLDVNVGEFNGAGRLPVSLRVSDTGIGMPEDVQRRLFQPFMQADASTTRRFGGTGLGLSIVRQLVEMLGGRIQLHSAAGQGSVFQVDLEFPVAAPDACPSSRPSAVDDTGAVLLGVRVLVVDDNPLNREVAERILRSEGAIVSLACDGQDAVAWMADGGSACDAVLMDVQMPTMDGLEATRRIRAMAPERRVAVIGLTAGVSSDERRTALEAGMDAVVGKPFDPVTLVSAISDQLRLATGAAGHIAAEPAELTLPPGWPAVPGLDAALAFRRLKGDRGLLQRMLQSLRGMIEACALVSAQEHPSEQALQELVAVLHDLKAIAGTLGASELQSAAGHAERLLRARQRPAGSEALRRVTELGWPIAQAAFPDEASRQSQPPQDPLPRSAGNEAFRGLLARLVDRDLAALKTSQALAGDLRSALGPAVSVDLIDKIHALDFEAAAQILQAHVEPLT